MHEIHSHLQKHFSVCYRFNFSITRNKASTDLPDLLTWGGGNRNKEEERILLVSQRAGIQPKNNILHKRAAGINTSMGADWNHKRCADTLSWHCVAKPHNSRKQRSLCVSLCYNRKPGLAFCCNWGRKTISHACWFPVKVTPAQLIFNRRHLPWFIIPCLTSSSSRSPN